MDDADRAQSEIDRALEAAIASAAAMARQVLGHHPTSSKCRDCGFEIEPPRLAHGFCLCAACAREAWDIEERVRRNRRA